MPPDDIWKILNRNDHHMPIKDAEDFLRPLLKVPDITANHIRSNYSSQQRSGSARLVKFHSIASGHLILKIKTHVGLIDLTIRIPETQRADRPAFLAYIIFEYEEKGIFVDIGNSNLFKTKDYASWPRIIKEKIAILYQVQENEKQQEGKRDEERLNAMLQRAPAIIVPETQGVELMSLTAETPETPTEFLTPITSEEIPPAQLGAPTRGPKTSTSKTYDGESYGVKDFPDLWHIFKDVVEDDPETKKIDTGFEINKSPRYILQKHPDIKANDASTNHFVDMAEKKLGFLTCLERQGKQSRWLVKDVAWPQKEKPAAIKEVEMPKPEEETSDTETKTAITAPTPAPVPQESAEQLTLLEALIQAFETNQKPRSVLAEHFPVDGDFLTDELKLQLGELREEAETKIATIQRAVKLAIAHLEYVQNLIHIQENQEG